MCIYTHVHDHIRVQKRNKETNVERMESTVDDEISISHKIFQAEGCGRPVAGGKLPKPVFS